MFIVPIILLVVSVIAISLVFCIETNGDIAMMVFTAFSASVLASVILGVNLYDRDYKQAEVLSNANGSTIFRGVEKGKEFYYAEGEYEEGEYLLRVTKDNEVIVAFKAEEPVRG